jgi:hypothetical protein
LSVPASPVTALSVPEAKAHGRDLRLDACRGLALWFIFLDHISKNVFSWLTLRNYGFSDTTEVFVFVSGYTCMLAYGGALREQGWPTIIARALRRGFEIYAAFLLLLIGYFVLIWAAGGGSRYLDETNTAFFFRDPGRRSSTPRSCNIRPSTPTSCPPSCCCIWPFRSCCGS